MKEIEVWISLMEGMWIISSSTGDKWKCRSPMVIILKVYNWLLSNRYITKRRESPWGQLWSALNPSEQKLCKKLKKMRDETIHGISGWKPSHKQLTKENIDKIRKFESSGKMSAHPRSAGWVLGKYRKCGTLVNRNKYPEDIRVELERFMDIYNREISLLHPGEPIISFGEFLNIFEKEAPYGS